MTRLEELTTRLTPVELKEVEDFAAFLVAKRSAQTQPSTGSKIRFEGWAGCLSHVDKSAVELAHEVNDIRIKAAEKQ